MEISHSEHIDLEVLEEFLQGTLEEMEAEAVRRHLDACTLCGLEIKRLERFAGIDSDADLARDAEWLYAQRKLEQAFKEKIVSSASPKDAEIAAIPRAVRFARWLVPAAAVVVMISYFAVKEKPQTPPSGRSVMRGAPAAVEYGIELEEPAGEVETSPAVFRWASRRENDQYTLEIFTPTLERIYLAKNIAESSWKTPDTLGVMLKPNVIYLWSVRGYRGLERPAASPNGWFRIEP